jgi:hypothetical protein
MERDIGHTNKCLYRLSIGVGLFLSIMDTTIVATMLYKISEEFGGFRLSPWVILSYTLSYVGK